MMTQTNIEHKHN